MDLNRNIKTSIRKNLQIFYIIFILIIYYIKIYVSVSIVMMNLFIYTSIILQFFE